MRATHGPHAQRIPPIFVPALFLIVTTIVDAVFDLDRTVSRFVLDSHANWLGQSDFAGICHLFYDIAAWPGIVIGCVATVLIVKGLWNSKAQVDLACGIFLLLVLVIGPGLVINGLLKTCWGRPRPSQITEFGGDKEFVNAGLFGDAGANSSFPCGHASIAFYAIVPAFHFWKQQKQHVAVTILVLGTLFGALVGTARILQGGHFLSDVFWSAGIVYLTAAAFYPVLKSEVEVRQALMESTSAQLQVT